MTTDRNQCVLYCKRCPDVDIFVLGDTRLPSVSSGVSFYLQQAQTRTVSTGRRKAGLEKVLLVAVYPERGTWGLRPERLQTGSRLGEIGRAAEGDGLTSAS